MLSLELLYANILSRRNVANFWPLFSQKLSIMNSEFKKERVTAYVDGFNLYFGMKENGKWYVVVEYSTISRQPFEAKSRTCYDKVFHVQSQKQSRQRKKTKDIHWGDWNSQELQNLLWSLSSSNRRVSEMRTYLPVCKWKNDWCKYCSWDTNRCLFR